ncbi:MAG: hypothetical protein Q6373_020055 [Candidatus Sigynarchaeota archaeon]
MESAPKKYIINEDFSSDSLNQLSWVTTFFTDTLHTFRWSGLSGMVLDHDAMSVIGFLPVFHADDDAVSGFAISVVRKDDTIPPPLFAIPVGIKVESGAEREPRDAGAIEAIFQFKNGIHACARILINDMAFWKMLGRVLMSQSVPKKELIFDMLDPGFSIGIKSIGTLKDDDIDLLFLGGGDTTNIVIKFKMHANPGMDFVLKFYPRVAFNTSRFLNDMLASARFHKFARLVATCDYTMETVQRFFHDSRSGAYFDQIALSCAALNFPVNRFFPFIHFFQFIPGNGDGGMPFWNSAVSPYQDEMNAPGNDIVDITTRLGKTIAEFHQALRGKTVYFAENGAFQLQKLIRTVESQFRTIRAHLIEYQKILPKEYAEMISKLIQMLEFQEISRKMIPDEAEYQRSACQYIHQDLHMGQLMYIDALKEFYILDLEGDPQLPWNERIEGSPIERDIASLVRSLSYIKITALRNRIEREFKDVVKMIPRFNEIYPLLFLASSGLVDYLYSLLEPTVMNALKKRVTVLNAWERNLHEIIIDSYAQEQPISKKNLLFFTLLRILNEITYEIKFRPGNVFIPCVGLLELIEK